MGIYQETNRSAKTAIAEDGNWLFGVPAIVADNNDPENQHRIRVIIPSIDEDLIFDEYARQMVFCLGNGYGSAFIPPKGSEVVLFGQLGQKFNLFYASLYNEEMLMPADFENEMSVGISAPGNLTFIAQQMAKIQAQNIDAIAAEVAQILANNININAEQDVTLSGDNVTTNASQNAVVSANSINLNADGQLTIHADGSMSVTGGTISISGSSVTIEGRLVKKVGPPI